jgi:predicted aldo/keto reductase-like oxidoreductase
MSVAFDKIFPIGLGTARFPFNKPETFGADFENAVNLTLYALENGVNYIDIGKDYSNRKAISVLKEVFKRTDKDYNVTVKVNCFEKLTADDYYKEALFVLGEMGIQKASHFLLWSLMDNEQFRRATGGNSLYDAAVRLKNEGKIKYIGASLHLKHSNITDVINSGLFEFVLISYSLLNFFDMQPTLDMAYEKNVDILVMNPLYGGLIPQNENLFEYAKFDGNETIVQASVRAVLSHPAVKCVLAGASSAAQLDEYLSAVKLPGFDDQKKIKRIEKLKKHIAESNSFCTYCRYCADCPKKIPVSEIMNARNIFILQDNKSSNSAEKIFFQHLHEKFNVEFESFENPCVKCGQCEKKCTQHLDIIKSVGEIYKIVGKTCYDKVSRRKRFDELINNKNYEKIGFWPASNGTIKILEIYKSIFGKIPFEVCLFDSNADLHGKAKSGHIVRAKSEAKRIGVECILITSFNHGGLIREQIKDLEALGIDVKVLYQKDDVDWWW